jgi:hypothetical protein
MDYAAKARHVVGLEIAELERLRDRIDGTFEGAIRLLVETLAGGHKIIVCGVGKSGTIGRKIAATFNSTLTRTLPSRTRRSLRTCRTRSPSRRATPPPRPPLTRSGDRRTRERRVREQLDRLQMLCDALERQLGLV